eukprot:TRINITY_DN24386_c0_g1_i2.p1 TRINITY_DN24386_c0_g1~~TRINITY_DN24386_c0_g1_i2.p1  ORF type:complete len:1500 (-),score=279.92 TRINITY_DN24386_c0_g1_i2:156-4655(-)
MQTIVVSFTIHDARNLRTQDGGPCSPFVVVECCGNQYKTEIMENKLQHVQFNNASHMWTSIQLYPEEFESAYIEFSLYQRNWVFRNYLIGKASLQLASVNKRVGHIYANKSLYLRQPGCTEGTGTINLNVFCLLPGDTAPTDNQQSDAARGDEEGGEDWEDDLGRFVLGKLEAPSGRPYHVFISVLRVEHLSAGTNPFVTVEFAGCCQKTEAAFDVEQYTWNMVAKIPVQVPVFEDTILIKLWHKSHFLADELLAQGLISFSELRNNSLPPSWFCLYGWDPSEVPDIKQISMSGEKIKPNFYKGKLLIGGRVEQVRVEEDEELSPACIVNAPPAVEPSMQQVALLADVYEVCGAIGRECQVQIMVGREHRETAKWVTPKSKEKVSVTANQGDKEEKDENSWDNRDGERTEEKTTFVFEQSDGRIPALLVMATEDVKSQAKVLVNVYTRGVLSGRTRIGFLMCHLEDFPKYELQNPSKPRFLAMDPMPYNTTQRLPCSVLMVIDRHTTDDVPRHNRKNVRPMAYICRAYVFIGRNIFNSDRANLPSYALRVACAGISLSTEERQEVRPKWMQMLELKLTLMSDHPKEPPTMEPITVTLCEQVTGITGGKRQKDLGKTVCTYEYLRRMNDMDEWEPYRLNPQWIKIYGGEYGSKTAGDVLIAFELLQWRHQSKLDPPKMWPKMQEDSKKDDKEKIQNDEPIGRLKSATLHFTLYGLRDIVDSSAVVDSSLDLDVDVAVIDFSEPEETGSLSKFSQTIHCLAKTKDEQLSKWDIMNRWRSDALGFTGCWNYEVFETISLKVWLPDKPLLQPYISIKVKKKPYVVPLLGEVSAAVVLGEYRQDLSGLYPCCWYPNVDVNKPYVDQEKAIAHQVALALAETMAKDVFVEDSQQEREAEIKRLRDLRQEERKGRVGEGERWIEANAQDEENINSQALPLQLRRRNNVTNKLGYTHREKLMLKPEHRLNMQMMTGFKPRNGEKIRKKGEDVSRPVAPGNLESIGKSEGERRIFCNDFWFKNKPLLLGHDLIDPNDPTDWSAGHGQCFGFIKCVFKLTDGHNDEPKDEDGESSKAIASAPSEETDQEKLRRTFGFDNELNKYAFNVTELKHRFKGKDRVPSRVRVRIYFVKAICIFGKNSGFCDPFLTFCLGKNLRVSMKNNVKHGTNQPIFYRVEERDIDMPTESRLQISMCDMANVPGGLRQDPLIGETVLDLEDRWHSTNWREANELRRIPFEHRQLFNPAVPGQNFGNLEMWVEMLDSVHASDRKAAPLTEPKPMVIEVRIVIWTTKNVKRVDGDKVDVKVNVDLSASTYEGAQNGFPKMQTTDVHKGSKTGDAEFNYRIVYPQIIMPTSSVTVTISVVDDNVFGADTFVGQTSVDLKRYVEKVAKEMDMIATEADLKLFPSQLEQVEEGPTEGKEEADVGSIQFLLQVMTQSEAIQKKAGKGREEPNQFPQLLWPAEGRGWGNILLDTFGFELPSFGIWSKLIPLVAFAVACLLVLRYLGLF